MARFETSGLDELLFDMEELAALPDSVVDGMLDAGVKVIVQGQQEELAAQGLKEKTGKLKASIKANGKRRSANERYCLIYPSGEHHAYRSRSKGSKSSRSKYRRGKDWYGGSAHASNNDVGFVHEFGGHGNRARQWMRVANEKNIDKAVDAEFKVYDDYLKSKGL